MPVYRNIQKRKSGKFQVQIMRNGKLHIQTFSRMIDAMQFVERIKQGADLPERKTFAASVSDYMRYSALSKKASTLDSDKMRLKFFCHEIGHLYVDKIQPRHIEELIRQLKDRGIKNATVNRYMQNLNAVLNYLLKRRVIPYNPFTAVGMMKVDQQSFGYWDFKECEAFLDFARGKYEGTTRYVYYLLYLIALSTGLRRSELLALKWEDIDLKRKLITVRRTYCRITRKLLESTKGRRVRYVPINSVLEDELRLFRPDDGGSGLILTRDGSVMDPNNFCNRVFRPDLKESGVRKIRFHDMRHTFASHYMMNASDIFHLQKILGHASVETTMRYAHLSKDFLGGKADVVVFGRSKNVLEVDFNRSANA